MCSPILLTAFCRPQLTIDSAKSILTRFPNRTLYISQDGKIPGFFEQAHEETRKALIQLALEFPDLELNLREKNQGLTQHLEDTSEKILKKHNNLIFLEEDMQISDEGVEFLSGIESDSEMGHRCAYSSTSHPQSGNNSDFRLSFFPEQWGISINRETFEAFKYEKSRKSVGRDSVRRIILSSGYGKLEGEILTDFWTQLFRQELMSPHGWDATLQLALWKNQVPSRVALGNHVSDLGGGIGAITSRTERGADFASKDYSHNSATMTFCIACEKLDSKRRSFSSMSQIRSRLRIRSRFQNYLQMKRFS